MAKEEFELPKDLDEYFKIAKDPLVKSSNMVMEMRDEVVDIIVQFTEGKYANDYEKSSNVSRCAGAGSRAAGSPWRASLYGPPCDSQLIKENLDKKFGSSWHVVVGKHFAYDITCEARHMVQVGGRDCRSLC